MMSSVIYLSTEQTHGNMEPFVLYNDQKRKKTDTPTCLVPQFQVFLSPKRYFSSYLYTVSSKTFATSFLAQSRIVAKRFCKTASLVVMTRWQLL